MRAQAAAAPLPCSPVTVLPRHKDGYGKAFCAAFAAVLVFSSSASAGPIYGRTRVGISPFETEEQSGTGIQRQLETAPPEQKPALQKQLAAVVAKIDTRANAAPADPAIQQAAAKSLLKVGSPSKAVAHADNAVRLAPRDPEARVVRAQVSYALKDYGRAADDARMALRLDPGNVEARTVLRLTDGRALTAGGATSSGSEPEPGIEPSAAKVAAQQLLLEQGAVTAGHAQVEALVDQAKGALKLGDRAQALSLLGRAMTLEPANGRFPALSALALLAPGAGAADASRALALARQGVLLSPKNAMAQVALGRALEATGGSPDEILAAYQAAAEDNPAFASEYQAALARRQLGGQAAADAAAATTSSPSQPSLGDSARDLLFNRLPEAARRGWPWLSIVAAVAFVAWTFLAKRQLS